METRSETAGGAPTTRQKRVITGGLAGAFAIAAVLWLPSDAFFVGCLILFGATAAEYARMVRRWAPSAPLGVLPALVVVAAASWFGLARAPTIALSPLEAALAPALAVVLAPALLVLWSKTRVPEAGIALGLVAYGLAYFTLAMISTYWLHVMDPWLLLALFFVVWAGDSVAYFAGSAFGKRRLAPIVSPNKTWEGSAAGLVASVGVLALWSAWRLDAVRYDLLVVGAITAVAGQIGDLVESLFKRGVGVKDSSNLLPGHGGLYDRLDALLFAAPVFLLGVAIIGLTG